MIDPVPSVIARPAPRSSRQNVIFQDLTHLFFLHFRP